MLNNLDLFDVTDNKPAQSTTYIAEEVLDECHSCFNINNSKYKKLRKSDFI